MPNVSTARVAGACLLGLGGLAAAAGIVKLADAAHEMHAARAGLSAPLPSDASAPTELARRADVAAGHARRAASFTRSGWLTPWTVVPIVGRQVRWSRREAGRWADLSVAAAATADGLATRLAQPSAGPAARMALLDRTDHELGDLLARIATPSPSPAGLVPPFSGAASRARADEQKLVHALDQARVAVAGLQRFLAGPEDYLILAANNAEMRGLGGMALQAGLVHATNGMLFTGDFHATGALQLPRPAPVPQPLDQLYGWLGPGREWRNTDSSPDFPEVAPVYADMAQRAGFGHVGGVMQVDVVTLDLLLGVTGPVSAGGTTFTAANAERLVMHDLYATDGDVEARRNAMAQLAVAISAAIQRAHVPSAALVQALRQAAEGRHLLVWSADPAEEAGWQALHVDGSLRPDGLLVAVQNQGGNKLDWFVRPAATLQALETRSDGRCRYRLTVALPVPALLGEPDYVVGNGSLGLPRGAYRALVTLYLPATATDVSIDPTPATLAGQDGPMRVVGVRLDVDAGATGRVAVDFSLPRHAGALTLIPDGRVQPMAIQFDGRGYEAGRPRLIALAG